MTTERNAFNKPILQETPNEFVTNPQANFDESRFKDLLQDKGQDILLEKALTCPCVDKATKGGLTNCLNCGGTGWFFVSKKKTLAIIQSINRKTQYQNWNEDDRGTINATFRSSDRYAFMDRITLLNSISTYSQVMKFTKLNSKIFAYTVYVPLAITDAFLFNGSGEPLKLLTLLEDYTIEDNKIVLNNVYDTFPQELSMTIRYSHYPQYHVIDIPREVSMQKGKNCTDEDYLKSFPTNAICRKSHYLMEAPNAQGESLYDNTDYSTDDLQTLLNTISPGTLLYNIVSSTAQQIADALHEEGDNAKVTQLLSLLQ